MVTRFYHNEIKQLKLLRILRAEHLKPALTEMNDLGWRVRFEKAIKDENQKPMTQPVSYIDYLTQQKKRLANDALLGFISGQFDIFKSVDNACLEMVTIFMHNIVIDYSFHSLQQLLLYNLIMFCKVPFLQNDYLNICVVQVCFTYNQFQIQYQFYIQLTLVKIYQCYFSSCDQIPCFIQIMYLQLYCILSLVTFNQTRN
ncbi:Hypothetical_protein [Hexamita inflata]|uniref:Hypothetical_protein n=1 Tax=Hexamita inflata TaxID=28002 RepID=A0AA86R2N4_9EUKA|nr:Hypothetical protein HINF_LOCUS55722 [Hexamita inflata]